MGQGNHQLCKLQDDMKSMKPASLEHHLKKISEKPEMSTKLINAFK